jgi:F-box protein, helicase, 18
MKLTAEQKEIVATSVAPGECLKVVAYAGTGKTTTLEYYANAHPEPTLYLAFNKSVQQHAERRFPPNVKLCTIHALAYSRWKRNTGGHGQVANSISPWVLCKAFRLTAHWAFVVVKTLENWFNSADPELATDHVPIDLNEPIPEPQKAGLVGLAERVWNKMLDQEEWFTMTHSGYLKAFQLEKPLLEYETIMLDEAQDTNPVTFDIILNQLDNGTRLIMVGDPYQQIYSWRQAIDAMANLEAKTLYLTRSFRFGKNIAEAASTVLRTFFGETRPVLGLDKLDAIVPRLEADKLTYVCRTNATIFEQGAFAAQQGQKIALAAGHFEQFLEEIMDIYYLYAGQVSKIRDKRIARFRDFKTLLEFASLIDPELESKAQIVMKHGNRVPTMVQDIRNASVVMVEEADILLTTCAIRPKAWSGKTSWSQPTLRTCSTTRECRSRLAPLPIHQAKTENRFGLWKRMRSI